MLLPFFYSLFLWLLFSSLLFFSIIYSILYFIFVISLPPYLISLSSFTPNSLVLFIFLLGLSSSSSQPLRLVFFFHDFTPITVPYFTSFTTSLGPLNFIRFLGYFSSWSKFNSFTSLPILWLDITILFPLFLYGVFLKFSFPFNA